MGCWRTREGGKKYIRKYFTLSNEYQKIYQLLRYESEYLKIFHNGIFEKTINMNSKKLMMMMIAQVRPLWRSYTRATDGIIFVLDAADR